MTIHFRKTEPAPPALKRPARKLAAIVLLLAFACSKPAGDIEPLRVYAAASLTTALMQLGQTFESERPSARIEFNFAASSILARQIEHGAHADLYISANPEWMDYLETKGLLRESTRKRLLSNRLVVAVPTAGQTKIERLADLLRQKIRRIAVADWTHVPAGIYARRALRAAGMWTGIQEKCVAALDARAALAYVERGNVDCGIVYASDAAISQRVRVALTLPDSLQPDIHYPAAVTSVAQNPLARAFLDFLGSNEAARVFADSGFLIRRDGRQR